MLLCLIHNLIEFNDNYSETCKILWKYCRDKAAANADCATVNFVANNTTILFKIKNKNNR